MLRERRAGGEGEREGEMSGREKTGRERRRKRKEGGKEGRNKTGERRERMMFGRGGLSTDERLKEKGTW